MSFTMRRRLGVAALLLTATAFLVPSAVKTLGTWLIVDDPLQPARSIVVLGGQVPFRAVEAAAIYHQGWAPVVWLLQGRVADEDLALSRLGIEPPDEATYSRQVLLRLGVPGHAIRLFTERNVNTADEVRTVARTLQSDGGDRAILVTSKSHSRRVRILWRALIGQRPDAVVRYASDDPFKPERWWRDTPDATAVVHEWFGLLNVWIGFPIKSARD